MASKIIIGIHGMGNKPPKETLEMWWKASIMEGLERINQSGLSLDFELFYWIHYIHPVPLDPAIKDKKNPLYIDQPYFHALRNSVEKRPSEFRKKVLDYLNRQAEKIILNKDFTLNYASVNDFVIRHFFNDLEIYYNDFCVIQDKKCPIKTAICSELADLLKKHHRKKILLIAHSMGSIIAYEVLTRYASEVPIDTFVTIGSPLGLPVIKSRIMAEAGTDHAQEIGMKTPENVRSNWYNLSDLKDKIAFNYKLADDFAENTGHLQPLDRIVTNNYEFMGEKNPHQLYGYLRTPEMAEIICDFLGRPRYHPPAWVKKLKDLAQAVGSRLFSSRRPPEFPPSRE